MSKAKRVMNASLLPLAECVGVADDTPCHIDWSCGGSPLARDHAKEHAEMFPGHRLRVVTENVDLYIAEASS